MILIKTNYQKTFIGRGTVREFQRKTFANDTKDLLELTLTAGDDVFEMTLFNTKKSPQKVMSTIQKLHEGDTVKVGGSISQREYENKMGELRTVNQHTGFYVQHVDEDEHLGIYATFAGIVEKKLEGEETNSIILKVIDDFSKKVEKYTIEFAKTLDEFFDDIDLLDNISIVAEIRNRTTVDMENIPNAYGAAIDGVTPAGIKRTYERKFLAVSGYILAKEDELEDEEDVELDIDNEEIPF